MFVRTRESLRRMFDHPEEVPNHPELRKGPNPDVQRTNSYDPNTGSPRKLTIRQLRTYSTGQLMLSTFRAARSREVKPNRLQKQAAVQTGVSYNRAISVDESLLKRRQRQSVEEKILSRERNFSDTLVDKETRENIQGDSTQYILVNPVTRDKEEEAWRQNCIEWLNNRHMEGNRRPSISRVCSLSVLQDAKINSGSSVDVLHPAIYSGRRRSLKSRPVLSTDGGIFQHPDLPNKCFFDEDLGPAQCMSSMYSLAAVKEAWSTSTFFASRSLRKREHTQDSSTELCDLESSPSCNRDLRCQEHSASTSNIQYYKSTSLPSKQTGSFESQSSATKVTKPTEVIATAPCVTSENTGSTNSSHNTEGKMIEEADKKESIKQHLFIPKKQQKHKLPAGVHRLSDIFLRRRSKEKNQIQEPKEKTGLTWSHNVMRDVMKKK